MSETATSSAQSTTPVDTTATMERLNIPFIVDRIDVTDPELIKIIEQHPDVDRVHCVQTKDKPWWVNLYFPTTRFLDRQDHMFLPLTSDQDSQYARRRSYIEEMVKDGIAEEDVKKIAKLLHTSAPEEELSRAVVNAVNRRFYGKDVPDEIVKEAGETADKLSDAITSFYFPAIASQGKVMDFIEANPQRLQGCPVADFSHHIGASVHLLTPACQYLYNEKDRKKSVLDIFTQDDMPLTIQTPRIAIRDTDLGGRLKPKAKMNWTVFVLQIRSAAAETKNPLFTFGAGVDRRQCCFKFVFQKLMEDLQVELQKLEGAGDSDTESPSDVDASTSTSSSQPSSSQPSS